MSGRRRGKLDPETLIRPLVKRLHAYVPGEQPKVKNLIKLNTNENPYPPAPGVLKAMRDAVDGRLRLYPNPTAQPLRERLAELHGCFPENIVVGNGSDELLALATRVFVEPAARNAPRRSKSVVQYFSPSYSLYPVLCSIAGVTQNVVPLAKGYSIPSPRAMKATWDHRAGLSFVTTPNAPSGAGYSTRRLEALCRAQEGVVILDEAYVDFAEENAMSLALKHPNVLVSRTFSKAYSLCFQRIGYFVGHPVLIQALDKVRDSYNVNGLAQVGAMAALDHLAYYRKNFKKIIGLRSRVSGALARLGFEVLPSQTNFLLVRPPAPNAQAWLKHLREDHILVRWFDAPGVRDYLRVTIGTEEEMKSFLRSVKRLV